MKNQNKHVSGVRGGGPYDFAPFFSKTRFFSHLLTLALLSVLILPTSCKKEDEDTPSTLNAQDRAFFDSAAVSNMAEIDLGNLALAKSTDTDVRAFAQMMVTMHSSQHDSLKTLASKKGVTLPAALPAAKLTEKSQLSALPANAFDQKYINNQVASHQLTQTNFQMEISGGNDADVKAFATAKLPAITSHLQLAQQIKTSKGF